MTTKNSGASCGEIFLALLQVLFIALKLTGAIDWSWWWVFSPTLFAVGFLIFVVLVTWVVYAYVRSFD